MIPAEKLGHALYALHGIMIALRREALEGRDLEKMATVLDLVEELPRYLAKQENMWGSYEETLEDLARRYPEFGIGLERFRLETPPPAW